MIINSIGPKVFSNQQNKVNKSGFAPHSLSFGGQPIKQNSSPGDIFVSPNIRYGNLIYKCGAFVGVSDKILGETNVANKKVIIHSNDDGLVIRSIVTPTESGCKVQEDFVHSFDIELPNNFSNFLSGNPQRAKEVFQMQYRSAEKSEALYDVVGNDVPFRTIKINPAGKVEAMFELTADVIGGSEYLFKIGNSAIDGVIANGYPRYSMKSAQSSNARMIGRTLRKEEIEAYAARYRQEHP